jgi:hypothetical protein
VARDVQRPDTIDITTPRPAEPGDPELFHPEDREPPRARPGAYWTGLVVLAVGLAVTVAALATRVTSIVQTILLAVPLALVGIGLERVGRGTGRGSLRSVGVLLLVVAVVGPLVLSLSSPGPAVTVRPNEPVPPGAARAELRASMGGGQLQVGSGAAGLYASELRGPGRPSAQVTTAGDRRNSRPCLSVPARCAGPQTRHAMADPQLCLLTGAGRLKPGAPPTSTCARRPCAAYLPVSTSAGRPARGDPASRGPRSTSLSATCGLCCPDSGGRGQVDNLSVDGFGDEGLDHGAGAWRAEGSGTGRYLIRVRASAARLRLHRG